jgi:hypothetical protein
MAKVKHTNVKGHHKDSATKNTFNPPTKGGPRGSQTDEPFAQDPKGRRGQFGGEGEPHMIKY